MTQPVLEGNIGKGFILNHEYHILSTESISKVAHLLSDSKYYEVIRCIDGIPLFIEDHIDRLTESIGNNFHWTDSDFTKVAKDIGTLLIHENITDGNVKVIATEGYEIVFASAFYYPPAKVYDIGINMGILNWNRNNPNVKELIDEYKEAVTKKLSLTGSFGKYFETLLVSDDGRVTEGSRSNVFFVSENFIYTAPDDLVLKGITRKYILESINSAGFTAVFECVYDYEIGKRFEAAFMSGTSVGVLPISHVEDIVLNSSRNSAIIKIRQEYDKIVGRYLDEKKSFDKKIGV